MGYTTTLTGTGIMIAEFPCCLSNINVIDRQYQARPEV